MKLQESGLCVFLLHRGVVIEQVTAFDIGGGIQWSRMGERTNGTACQSQALLPHKQQPWETLKGQHTAPKVGGPSQTFLSTHELHPHIRRPWSPPSFPLTGTGTSWGQEQAPTGPREVALSLGVLSTVVNCAHSAMQFGICTPVLEPEVKPGVLHPR